MRRQTLHVSQLFRRYDKKTTGDTASNYIRQYVIQRAKSDFATGASIAQVADGLGFEYPQHLSRMFKDRKDSPRKNIAKDFGKRSGSENTADLRRRSEAQRVVIQP
ncbi:MAG: helix-turn-helix domain-containing protein [Alistipes onderdonkii]